MLSAWEVLRIGRLMEFNRQGELRGVGSIDLNAFNATIRSLDKPTKICPPTSRPSR